MRLVVAMVVALLSVLIVMGGYPVALKSLAAGEDVAKSLVRIAMPIVGAYGTIALLRRLPGGHLCCIAFLIAATALQLTAVPLADITHTAAGRALFTLLCAGFLVWDMLIGVKIEAKD